MNLKKKLALSLFWMLLGLALIVLSVTEVLKSSYVSGLGGGLLAVGALQSLRWYRCLKNPEVREKYETEVNDERNRFLSSKSWAWTGYIVVLIEGFGSVIAMLLGREQLQQMLAFSVCLIVGVYWIVYMILSRKY